MANDKKEPLLVSRDVLLREVNIGKDAPQIYIILKNPDIHRWLGTQTPRSVQEVGKELKRYQESDDLYAWSIIDNHTGNTIGTYYLWKPITQLDGGQIIPAESQRLARSYWRKGYMKECRNLVYEFAFNKLEVEEIHAQVWKNNINSVKSMEDFGFIKVGEAEKTINKFNKKYIEYHYSLSKDNFKKNKR